MSQTVLVVDDAAFVRRLIRRMLVAEGYEVHEAVNGRDAVDKYLTLRPDLVTLDMNMPGMGGLEALRAIREHDPDARVLVVSALQAQASVNLALEAGASDYVNKPFEPKRMLQAVRSCLQPALG